MFNEKKISACIIVHNEQKELPHCLASIRQIVDEIIVVDTGSTDRSKAIAKSYHAKVYDYEWSNDFAAARNFSLEKASGEWILYIDADERIDAAEAIILREVIEEEGLRLFGFKVVNYFGDLPVQYEHANLVVQYRLFRKQGVQFSNAIHEQLSFSSPMEAGQFRMLPVTIYHFGYLNHHIEEKDKLNRNIAILLSEKVKDSSNPWTDYHIANALYQLNEKVKAYEFINMAITGFIVRKKIPPSLLYRLKYMIALDVQQLDGAGRSIDIALQLHPEYVDLYYYKGLILKQLGDDAAAIVAFDHALALGEIHLQHLTQVGAGSFLAAYEKGECLERTSQQMSALRAYEQALSLHPNFKLAQDGLQRMQVLCSNGIAAQRTQL